MRSIWAFLLSIQFVIPPLYAQQSESIWLNASLKHFKTLQQLGPDAYIESLEKDINEPLILSDKKYLKKVLASSFRQVPPLLPELKKTKDSLEVLLDDKRSAFVTTEFSQSEQETIIKVNGNVVDTKNKTIEEITRSVWKLLSKDFGLGPYPEKQDATSHRLRNLFLPQAEASLGTIGTILVFATIIGAVVYYTKKVTKSSTRAIEKVGDSTSRGIDRVSASAANTIDKVGDEASGVLKKTGELTDAARETVESHKK